MANIHILADAPSDRGAYSAGAWAAGLPLANLVKQQPKQVARSVGLSAGATRFVSDLGGAKGLSTFALINSNFSRASSVRLRVAGTPDGANPVLDVTVPGFPPNVAFGTLPWGTFPWDGYRDDPLPAGAVCFYKHTETVFGRYVFVDIADAANPDGYVQIGRFMAGDAFVPKYNMVYGAAFSFLDDSKQTRSVGGQDWFDKKQLRRRFSWGFDALSESEAYGAVYDLQNRLGITGNLLVIYDPQDRTDIVQRRTLYGRMTTLENIITANASVSAPYTCQFNVEELI